MAIKKTGISADLVIHPGETIADVLEERNISQVELANRTGTSAAYISNVIAGKKDISSKFAMALEYALDVPKSFWLNLQANYEAEMLELNEASTITEDELAILPELNEVVSQLKKAHMISNGTQEDTILSLRKLFRLSDISKLATIQASGAFRMSTKVNVNPAVMGAWIRLCQIICEQNTKTIPEFDPQKVDMLIQELKEIMPNPDCDLQADVQSIMERYGIKFNIVQNFRGAPVQGYISRGKDNEYQMMLTIRGATSDVFWFSLFHEIGHIVNGDVTKASNIIETIDRIDVEKENAADRFAEDALLSRSSYTDFVNADDFGAIAIEDFAMCQGVPAYVVVGRLQKEGRLPYSKFNKYKIHYKKENIKWDAGNHVQ